MKALVTHNGVPANRDVPLLLDGGTWPRFDQVERFGSTLLSLHHSLNR
jgi:hypothetical protein